MVEHEFKVEDDGSVRIVIPLPPYTKKNSGQVLYKRRPDGSRVPFISPSPQYKAYERDSMWFLRPIGLTGPVNVEAKFYMETRRRVDLTNLNEALHDILVKGGVLVDDDVSVVVSTDGSRVYYDKENPRTEVTITPTEATFETAKEAKERKAREKAEKAKEKERKKGTFI